MQNHEIHSTQVDLDGLLEVLGRNLYSTPIVVVRELVQNAHDACIRRRVESDWAEMPKICVKGNLAKQTITISDNGSGLTHSEVIDYLATIGSGYTRELRVSKDNQEAVGYFGLGFLTAYVVARKVEFITTSYQSPASTCRFQSKGGKQYTLSDSEQQPIGTQVVLHLQEEFNRLAEDDYLAQLISRYCCLLPIDIFVGDNERPVNQIPIPWRLQSDVSDLRRSQICLEFAQIFDSHFEPVTTIPIPYDDEAKLSGILWIQDGSYYSTSDNRITTVFIRSMHITDDAKDLLPHWAGFVGCVIDSHDLTPTASRESVQEDEAFDRARALVKKTLIEALVQIASERGATWRRLQSRHNQSLLGASISDSQLFEAMHDKLEVPTSSGEMTALEAVRRTPDKKLTIALEQGGGFEHLVARSIGVPLVYGYRFAVMAFCRELSRHGGFDLRTLGGDDGDSLFPACEVDADLRNTLEQYFDVANSKVVISRFEPASLPAVRVLDQDALLKQRLESDDLERSAGSATLMLARSFTDTLIIEHDAYLYLNVSNPLIEKFLRFTPNKQTWLADTIVALTNLLAGDSQSASADDTGSVLEKLTNSLEGLAGHGEEL